MGIRLEKIAVQNLGPIRELNSELGNFNLFYGHNEQGKTFLVEFLIQSLFRNQSRWKNSFRNTSGGGRITVSGIGDETVEFEPTASQKLEDYLLEERPGLPSDIVRLMVVKGAEAGIDENGVSKTIVKKLLSSKEVLDIVDNSIKSTIRDATVESGTISGNKRTLIAEREEKLERIRKLDQLIREMEDLYSGGERQILEMKREELEKRRTALVHAKRHKAYELDLEKEELGRQRKMIPEEKLSQLDDTIKRFRVEADNYDSLKQRLEKAEQNSRHYEWLKQAEEQYSRYIEQARERPSVFWLAGLLLAAAATGVLIWLSRPVPALVALGVFLMLAGYYIYRYREALTYDRANDELARLQREYKERTGDRLANKAMLTSRLLNEENDYKRAVDLRDQLKEKGQELDRLSSEIYTGLKELKNAPVPEEKWETTVEMLQNKLKKLDEEIREREQKLARLDVDPSDYIKLGVDVQYSKEALLDVEQRLREIREQISRNDRELMTLKRRICDVTGDDESIEWEELISNLFDKRSERVEEYKELTAEIVGKNAVHRVIEGLRQKEDEKIRESLASEAVRKPIYRLTERYRKITMQDDELIVSDEYNDFPIDVLSTGAREQVLLALRIGFCAHLLKQDQLFLILDDAFQHSDWPSRETIIGQLAELAQQGWQIIYLTMDDHIRDLFNEVGSDFGEEYREIQLKSDD